MFDYTKQLVAVIQRVMYLHTVTLLSLGQQHLKLYFMQHSIIFVDSNSK